MEWHEEIVSMTPGPPSKAFSGSSGILRGSRPQRIGGDSGSGTGSGSGSPGGCGSARASLNKGYSFDNVEEESYFAVQARRAGSLVAADSGLGLPGGDADGTLIDDAFGELSPPTSPPVSAIWANVRRSVFGPPAGALLLPASAGGGRGSNPASRAASPERRTTVMEEEP